MLFNTMATYLDKDMITQPNDTPVYILWQNVEVGLLYSVVYVFTTRL
jgi:hypothetical protein